jgi:hypothetical protein
VIKKQEYKRIPYSDKKIKAKYAPEYSVLNPETSSDSDSLKSKGARWVSAKVQINQKGKENRKMGDAITLADRIEKENNKNLIRTIKVLKTDS